MYPRQDNVSCHAAHHLAVMFVLLQAAIGLQSVADNRGARRNGAVDKAGNAVCREVSQPVEPDAPGAAISQKFYRADDQQFADMAATLAARRRVVLCSVGKIA